MDLLTLDMTIGPSRFAWVRQALRRGDTHGLFEPATVDL